MTSKFMKHFIFFKNKQTKKQTNKKKTGGYKSMNKTKISIIIKTKIQARNPSGKKKSKFCMKTGIGKIGKFTQ